MVLASKGPPEDGPRMITKAQLQDAYTRAGIAALETMAETLADFHVRFAEEGERPGVKTALEIVRRTVASLRRDGFESDQLRKPKGDVL